LIEHTRWSRPGEFPEIGAHHALVEQRQRRARLGQRRQWFALRLGHVFEKVCHVGQPQFTRVPPVMKQDEASRPGGEKVGGGRGITAGPRGVP
jgi:hypothetical protein